MTLSGSMLIGASDVTGDEGVAHAINPATNQAIPNPAFGLGGAAHVDRAARLAAQALGKKPWCPLSCWRTTR